MSGLGNFFREVSPINRYVFPAPPSSYDTTLATKTNCDSIKLTLIEDPECGTVPVLICDAYYRSNGGQGLRTVNVRHMYEAMEVADKSEVTEQIMTGLKDYIEAGHGIAPAPEEYPRRHTNNVEKEETEEAMSAAHVPVSKRRWLLYFHGNKSDLGTNVQQCIDMSNEFKAVIIAVEYPGYGLSRRKKSRFASPTTPSGTIEFAMVAHVHATQQLGYDPSRLILCGHSIGTGVALGLAERLTGTADDATSKSTVRLVRKQKTPRGFVPHHPKAIVLHSPFFSTKRLANEMAWPCSILFVERFDNFARLSAIPPSIPVIITHGTHDQVIPLHHAECLMHARDGQNTVTRLRIILSGDHARMTAPGYGQVIVGDIENATLARIQGTCVTGLSE